MRVTILALLIPLAHAQFELFSRPSYEDSYNTISDVVGMNDALGVWGKMIRNLANRNHGSDALRQFTVKPQHVDVDQLKTLPKGKGEIINEKLLNMLLPRIKGQPAFTTTTKATTTTTAESTTTTEKPSTTTTEAPSTTTEAPTTKSTSTETAPAETTTSTVEETTTTKQETTTEEATSTTAEQPVDNLPVIAKSESNGGPQFTVVFHTADKSILDKKSNVEVVDFNQDKEEVKEVISTTKPTEKPKEKEEQTTKGTTVKKESVSTTEASTTTMSAGEIDLRRALKEKFDDDEEVVPKRDTDDKKTTESTTVEVTTVAAKTTTKKNVPKVDTTTKKPDEKKEKKDDKKEEKKQEVKTEEKKKEQKKDELKKEEKPLKKTDDKKKEEQKPKEEKAEEKKESVSKAKEKKDVIEKKNVKEAVKRTSEEKETKKTEEHEKKEEAKSDDKKKEPVNSEKKKDDGKKEELTKKDKTETKASDEKKKQKPEEKTDKAATALEKQTTDKKSEKKDKESTKKEEKTMSSTEVEAQIEKEASEILDLLNKPTNNTIQELRRKNLFDKLREYLKQQETEGKGEPQKATTKKVVSTTVVPTTTEVPKTSTVKEETATETSATTKTEETTVTPSTTEETATQGIITAEGVETTEKADSAKKTDRIPEAEEDEPAFVQEDVPTDETTTEAVPTTTLVHATPASAGTTGTVYNINANANSEANPQLANVITPIAGIMDSISPILAPLLGAGGAASRARARGSKTYELSYEPSGGRDILADSPGETSLVGFGTQLAREILSPGVLKRERMDRERMMAAKIDEARKMRESKSLLATVLDMAKTGPPLALPMITTPQPSVFAPNPQFSQQQGNFALHAANPPPGYNGPRAPLPPPPPPGYVPRGYTGTIPSNFGFPTTLSQQQDQSPITVDGSSAQTKNTPYYPPNLDTTTSAVNVKDEGFLQGRSGVRTTFMADSGVPMEHNPSASGQAQVAMPNLPAFGIAPASETGAAGGAGGGSGFGGGRQPSVSFDDSSRGLKQDNSFFTSRRRLRV